MNKQDAHRGERKRSRRWRLVALLATGVAIGATMAAAPATAHVGGSILHLWDVHIKPLADARYYTKAQVNAYSSAQSAHRSSGPSSAAAGPGFTTVVTQSVRPGFYVFVAKAVIITSSSTGSDCILTYDIGSGEVEADRSNQAPFNSSVTARTTHNLQRLLQFGSSSATIRLKCRAGTVWSASNSNIIAMRVASASDSEVSS
jgi:hypothetical protein